MRKLSLVAVFFLGFLCCYIGIAEATPIQWSANGNYYELILSQSGSLAPSWSEAVTAAAASTYAGVTGHLATISSAEENAFVFGLAPSGLTLPSAGWAGAWLGGKAPDGWLVGPESGDTFSFTNWNSSEPNNNGYASMRIDSSGLWYDDSVIQNMTSTSWGQGVPDSLHDPVIGYFVEYEGNINPVPEPATILSLNQQPCYCLEQV